MFDWRWNWGEWDYRFGLGFVSVLSLAVVLVPLVFFLLNLRDLLYQVDRRNRAMPAGQVWLNLIPVFGLGWFIHTVIKVKDSVRAEYRARGWTPRDDFGYSVGMAAGASAVAVLVLGWTPFFGWLLGLASLVCWIIYWVRTAALKNQLARGAAPSGAGPAAPRSGYGWSEAPGALGPAGASEEWERRSPGPGAYGAPSPSEPDLGAGPSGSQEGDEEDMGGRGEKADRCPACGFAFDLGDAYCRSCGKRLPQ